MKAGIICFTAEGEKLAERLREFLSSLSVESEAQRCGRGQLKPLTEKYFYSQKLLVFIGSCGLAVRAIAPHLLGKDRDPAVLVIDEKANFVISLLSGHLGGANAFTELIADFLEAQAVITTASDVQGLFAVDDWARKTGLVILDTAKIVDFASAYLAGKEMNLYSDFSLSSPLPPRIHLTSEMENADLAVVRRARGMVKAFVMIPACFSLGVGCRKGTPYAVIQRAVAQFLSEQGVPERCLLRMSSIDLKAEEEGLICYARETGIPFQTFSAEELNAVSGSESRSDFVRSVTGVDNVCERAALAGFPRAKLIASKTVIESVTLALAILPFELDFTM